MKALGSSCLKFSVARQRERVGVGVDFALCRHDFGFQVHQKRVREGLLSFRASCVASISTVASSQIDMESDEIQTVNSDQLKTVRVRFKLHKQCAFGQQFLVVGDDPNLGLWDPSDGVPLNWSEGHVWTAEVDIPSSKVINYKFILKEMTGTVSWQPGPDRVLETWDTANTISVTEDWNIPEFQIIDEEEVVDDVNELWLNDSDLLIAENSNQIVGEQRDDVMEELVDRNERIDDHSDEPSTHMVAENIAVDFGEQDLSLSDGESVLMSLRNETRLFVDEEVPVLVPGLSAMPTEEAKAEEAEAEASSTIGSSTAAVSDETVEFASTVFEESIDPSQKHSSIFEDITTESDKTEATTKHEIRASASLHYAETSELMAVEEKPRFSGRKKMESSILGSNMQWGRQALHTFLANLGFMQHS